MTPLEMIAGWRKGCSDAPPDAPEQCPECTRALIDALERKLRADAAPVVTTTTASDNTDQLELFDAGAAATPNEFDVFKRVWNGPTTGEGR